jgi:hypothetical protein
MARRSTFAPFVVTVVVVCIGLISYFMGYDAAEREHVAQAGQQTRETPAERKRDEVSLEEAVRIASDNWSKLGVPGDRYLLSVEMNYYGPRMVYLIRLWPPWPVSQPEDNVYPEMWRAIEVTREGRCYLTAVNHSGRDPFKTNPSNVFMRGLFEYYPGHPVPEGNTSLYDAAAPVLPTWPTPTKRRVILPPPE